MLHAGVRAPPVALAQRMWAGVQHRRCRQGPALEAVTGAATSIAATPASAHPGRHPCQHRPHLGWGGGVRRHARLMHHVCSLCGGGQRRRHTLRRQRHGRPVPLDVRLLSPRGLQLRWLPKTALLPWHEQHAPQAAPPNACGTRHTISSSPVHGHRHKQVPPSYLHPCLRVQHVTFVRGGGRQAVAKPAGLCRCCCSIPLLDCC